MINGAVLPVVLVFMLILINSPKLMGRHKNGKIYNVVSGITVVALVALTACYALSFIF